METPKRDVCPICGTKVWKTVYLQAAMEQGKLETEDGFLNVRPFERNKALFWRCEICGAEWAHEEY